MATSELPARGGCCSSQLMIVLLGGRNSGKHSLGNLLLGKEEFVDRERTRCSRRLGLVGGRRLTVVDTPGWWCDFSVQDTPELVKREIRSSPALCSPGPHAFLIAVKASSAFTEKRRRAVEEHVSLLGDGVWDHCVVVLTSDGGSRRADAGSEAGGEALRWLRERCRHRCHSVRLREGTDAEELLEEVEKLVQRNGNGGFQLQEDAAQAAAGQKKDVEARAQRRFTRARTHRALVREILQPVTDIRIVLLGAKGSGKTSALNTILGRGASAAPRATAQCQVGSAVAFGRRLTVVDTPGWWMNYFLEESSAFDRREMALSPSLCPPGPQVFLLVVRVDRAFPDAYGEAAQQHVQLIGDHVWARVMVLFTFGDWLGGTAAELHIESEGGPLQRLVDRCGNRYHVLNNRDEGGIQVRELIGKMEAMLAGHGGGWHYEVERRTLERLQEEVRGDKERAEERRAEKETRRQMARAQLEKLGPLPEITLVLVGGRKTGKSSCARTILRRGGGAPTASGTELRGYVGGRAVAVLDAAPVTPRLLAAPCAVLVVVNASSSFRGGHWEAAEEQLGAGGGAAWSRALVLFSHGDRLGGTGVEEHIESEGPLLRRLVEKCGNRYHVLDNKRWGDGAQVAELIDLTEEMLGAERSDVLHGRHHSWRMGPPAPEAVTARKKDFKDFTDRRHQPSRDCLESASSSSCPSLNCSDASGQIVAASAAAGGRRGRVLLDRRGFVSRSGEALRWAPAAGLPAWLPLDEALGRASSPMMLFVLPQRVEERATPPALSARTPGRPPGSGGPQALMDRRAGTSLEELEAFIDSYCDAVPDPTSETRPAPESGCWTMSPDDEELLASINRKLSKLELLEEIRDDLVELRDSLENSWRADRN